MQRNRSKQKAKPLKQKGDKSHLNFAGQANELWCSGGEVGFIKRMVLESDSFQNQVTWFTTLVSKKDSLRPIYKALEQVNVAEVRTVNMEQGSKISRFVAWRY